MRTRSKKPSRRNKRTYRRAFKSAVREKGDKHFPKFKYLAVLKPVSGTYNYLTESINPNPYDGLVDAFRIGKQIRARSTRRGLLWKTRIYFEDEQTLVLFRMVNPDVIWKMYKLVAK